MISDNLRKIQQEIQDSCALVSREPKGVTLIAVTKSVDEKSTREIIQAGVTHCAENRVDKLLEKKAALTSSFDICWHFIGKLQRRKVKLVINEINYFHALDSLSLAKEIQKRAHKKIRCFVEVNVSNEETKQGIKKEALLSFIEELAEMDKIEVVGLMTMAPLDSTASEQHEIFKQLHQLQKGIEALRLDYAPCHELSMGMSNDFSVAIQEGATFVRIGTALFKE